MKIPQLEEKYLANTYSREPLKLVEGKGVKVKDIEGNEYLDFAAGIAVCGLGHSHPEVVKTLRRQAKRLIHVSNLYHIPPQAELGRKLAEVSPKGIQKFFFCNSGTEAVEAALKLAVKHARGKKIVALEKSFHGRTSGSLAATWKKEYREPFTTLLSPSFEFVPNDDLEEARKEIDEQTAAVIVEPIQGEGGVNVLTKDFLQGLRGICDEVGALLIVDEIQTGMCRTGRWFACEHWGVSPDIITMAKALGNGFPIGATGARAEVMNSFTPGDHASTFGGNPLACAVAKRVIEIMEDEEIPNHVREVGGYFRKKLENLSERYSKVQDVRGKGLMLALELNTEEDAENILTQARKGGFLINRTAGDVLRFVPPLTVEKPHIDQLLEELNNILRRME